MKPAVTVLLLVASTCAAQNGDPKWVATTPVTPITLSQSWSKALEMPSFQYGELVKCDPEGSLYFHAAAHFNDSLILKLKPDGSYAMMTLAPEDASTTYFEAFRVSHDGVLRVLAHSMTGDQLELFEFRSEDENPKAVRLDVPAGLQPFNFQVSPRGEITILGYLDEKAPKNKGKSYLGKFDSAGQLLRESFDHASESVTATMNTWSATAAAAEADDGQSYLLSGNDVLILSANGDLAKTIHIDPPGKDYHPVNIFISGGIFVVEFYAAAQKSEGSGFLALYQTFDRYTGEELKLYKPAPELGNNLACFTKEGFTFLTVQKRHLKLVGAKP